MTLRRINNTDDIIYVINPSQRQSIIKEIKKTTKGKKLELYGVGGANLKKEGLKSLFDMSELSLMGFFEVVPHIPKLLKRIKQTTNEIIKIQPDIVITIDAPDFCGPLARR